jgi:AraC-like DNA-binding protein
VNVQADHLSDLFGRINLSARVFRSGDLCRNASFDGTDSASHLHVLRRGRISVINDGGEPYQISEPHLLFYPRPLRHILAIDATSPPDVVCASVEFAGGRANPLASTLPAFLAIPLKRLTGLAATLDCLFDEGFNPRNGARVILDRLCEILVVHLLRVAIEDGEIKTCVVAGLMDPRIAPAVAAIHANPEYAWGLQNLAERCNLSRSRFTALFKDRIGMTVGEYLTDWRIYVAQEKLRSGKPVTLVALDVGYGSQPAFTRAFASKVGVSPREWIKRHCNEVST